MCSSCWVCCENRQARQYWHIYNYFFAMTNHMFIIFSRVAVLLRFAQLMIFWQLKLFVQIKVTTVQLVRFKILYLDICYETVIEFCLLQEWYCRRLRLYLWTKVNVTSDMALHIMTKPLQKFENNKPYTAFVVNRFMTFKKWQKMVFWISLILLDWSYLL